MTPAPLRFVVLLRGINVSAGNQIAMADLRALLEEAGFGAVRTHLRSGNVLLSGAGKSPAVAVAVHAAIAARLGLQIPVIVRTGAELQAVIADDPLGEVATDGSRHFVAFLAEPLDPSDAARLEGIAAEGDDRFAARGCDLHLWCPGGVRDSQLAKGIMAKRFTPSATVRNWNTASRLAAMLREDETGSKP